LADQTQDLTIRILPKPAPVRKPGSLLPLRDVKPGTEVQLIAIRLAPEKRDPFYRQGFIESRHVRVLHNDFKGRIVLKLDGELFLLGRRETGQILVRELPESE